MFKKANKWDVYLVIVCTFLVFANLVWLKLDNRPPAWDQAAHLRVGFLLNEYFSGRPRAPFGELLREAYGYPPLVQIVVGIITLLVGFSEDKATFIISLFLVGFLVGVYRLTNEIYKSKKKAFWASMLTGLLPVTYQLSREMLLDLPLAGSVVWGVWFFIKSDKFSNRKWSALFMMSLIASSLIKLNGFIYYFPLFVWLVGDMVKRKRWFLIDDLFIYFCLYLFAVGWWWVVNFRNIFAYLGGLAGQGEPLTDPMNLLNFDTWVHYIRLFAIDQVFFIPFLVGMGVIVWYFSKKKISGEEKLLLFFVGVNYVVFTIIKNKDFRFVTPFLIPVFGVFLARGLAYLKKRGVFIGLGLLVYLIFTFLVNSFGVPLKTGMCGQVDTFLLGNFCALNFTGNYPVKKYRQESFPNTEIVFDLIEDIGESDRQQKMLVLINREDINPNNIRFYKDMVVGHDKFYPFAIPEIDEFSSFDEVSGFVKDYDYVLVGEKELETAPFYAINLKAYSQARDWVWENRDSYRQIGEYRVYGDEGLFLLKKI